MTVRREWYNTDMFASAGEHQVKKSSVIERVVSSSKVEKFDLRTWRRDIPTQSQIEELKMKGYMQP